MKRLLLRIPSDLSKRAVAAARRHHISLAEYVLLALEAQAKADEHGDGDQVDPLTGSEKELRKHASQLRPPAPKNRREKEPRRAKPHNRR
jgi:hypothetical protein